MWSGSPISPIVGSSPLARGLLRWVPAREARARIIPARAGFTRPGRPPLGGRPDHPRSRGVYTPWAELDDSWAGSSPLARGLPVRAARLAAAAWIIPARAGFTQTPAGAQAARVDHPRSRGVYTSMRSLAATRRGSSPLARGLPPGVISDRRLRRIIPARAGFTHGRLRRARRRADHPRSRGVYG